MNPIDEAGLDALEARRAEKNLEFIKASVDLANQFFDGRYEKAYAALDIGQNFHTGFRMDKVTPEFMHQVIIATRWMAHEAALVEAGIDVDVFMASILLHDYPEDKKNHTPGEMQADFKASIRVIFQTASAHVSGTMIAQKTEEAIAQIVHCTFVLNKKMGGVDLSNPEYFRKVVAEIIPFLVKLGDVLHNTETLRFLEPEKQVENFLGAKEFLIYAEESRGQHPTILGYPKLAAAVDDHITAIENSLLDHIDHVQSLDKDHPAYKAFSKAGLLEPVPSNADRSNLRRKIESHSTAG